MSAATSVTFTATDGSVLAGTLYQPAAGKPPSAAVLINAGAGIPATYYGRFATWLAAAGIPVLTYDYRGIGRSRPASMRGFNASVEDWGSKDCAAALATLRLYVADTPLIVLGHSVGCFATGFMQDPADVAALVFVAPHTGYYGDYAPRQRPWMWLAWHAMMPVATRMVGYFPGRRFGLPDDLPRGVALEWARRRHPDFWWNLRHADGTPDVERHAVLRQRFAAFRVAGLSVRIADDAFATAAGEARIQGLFASVHFDHIVVEPNANKLGAIGHFGFFRSASRDALWPIVGDWIAGRRWLPTLSKSAP
ncbi:MAG: alpha/beta fold hydrolase [Betaproteobacteria bacterium]